jgi:hypothetical protein
MFDRLMDANRSMDHLTDLPHLRLETGLCSGLRSHRPTYSFQFGEYAAVLHGRRLVVGPQQ